MCGLIGAFSPMGVDVDRLQKSLSSLHHRGPDAQTSVVECDGKVFLGHARLKIIDLTDKANQPMESACGRYVLVYNGEIVNYKQLRREVKNKQPWRTKTDSEVLLALFASQGKEAMHQFVGMFAFAILDRKEQKLILCRDRFGIKPLYYANKGDDWYFASEIPALLPHLQSISEDSRTILTYLETGLYDFGEHTFFHEIKALEPGCYLEIDLGTGNNKIKRWYNLKDHVADLSGLDEASIVEQAEELVENAIKDHLVADVDVGLNVSGGVDSSMLVRVALEHLNGGHLFAQDYKQYSEEPWIREIAHGGHLHLLSLNSNSILDVLPKVVQAEGEPFGGVFVCGYDYLYQEATKNNITVLLDGNGVDECFLGYKKYHQQYVNCRIGTKNYTQLQNDYQDFWGEAAGSANVSKNQLEGVAIDGTISTKSTVIADSFRKNTESYSIPKVNWFDDSVRNVATSDLLYTKIPRGLRFNDRISMANSKELRVPYLDHRLVEFALGIPTKLLLNATGTKSVFRKIAARKMPDGVAYARKRSVQSPQREWLAEEWRTVVTGVLDSPSFNERGWVDVTKAKRIYGDYIAGDKTNSFFIWQWLNLELWAREFLDSSAG